MTTISVRTEGRTAAVVLLCLWFATLMALISTPPNDLLTPGFSSLVVLESPSVVFWYSLAFVLIGTLWFVWGDSKVIACSAAVSFSFLFLEIWESKVPGGAFLFSGYEYSSILSQIQATGHFTFRGLFSYITIYDLGASLKSMSGIQTTVVLWTLEALWGSLIGLFSFLLANQYLTSSRLASIAVFLSVIGDFQLSKLPPFDVGAFGVLFVLIGLYAVKRLLAGPRREFPIVLILLLGETLVYPLTLLIVILVLVIYLLQRSVGPSANPNSRAASKDKGIYWILILGIALYSTWTFFTYPVATLASGFLRALLGPSSVSQGSLLSTSGGPIFYLLRLFYSNTSAIPGISWILPFWFIFLFACGGIVWLGSKILRKRRGPELYMVIPILLVGVLLFMLPGGSEWTRIMPYLGLFLSISFVMAASNPKSRIPLGVICVVVLVLSLPTIVAYYPTIGTNGAKFGWEIAAGNFLQGKATDQVIWADFISTANLSLTNQFVYGTPSSAVTTSEVLHSLEAQIDSFAVSRTEVFVSTPIFYQYLSHLYGSNLSNQILLNASTLISTNTLVYSNGYISMVFPAG